MPAIPALVTAGTTIYGASQQKKAQKKAAASAAEAARASQVDPDEIASKVGKQAEQNLARSMALEGVYAPAQQSFRNESIQALLERLRSGDAYGDQAMQSLSEGLASGDLGMTRSQLLTDAIARAAQDLAMGGSLDVQTRNEVMRKSLANAGAVGGGGLGLGRTITARDLGLTSMDVANDRLARAASLGQIEQQVNQADTQTGFQNRSLRAQLAQALQGASANRTGQQLGLAQFGQSLQPPTVGLDPASYADIFLGNAANASTSALNQAKLQAQAGRDKAATIGAVGGALGGVAEKIDWGKIFGGSKGP